MPHAYPLSTGLPGLDHALQGLRPGDNVVWQVDTVDDYVPFVRPYCAHALASGRRLVYFRFAKHAPLVSAEQGADVYELRPEEGFEPFITRIHRVIEEVGEGAYYLFDALSELTLELYSDRMLANFYMLTCPHLYALRTVAYYALLKHYHSYHASSPIAETTQILFDVYRHSNRLYVHPRKVQNRYSATMHMLHMWEGDEFRPVTESGVVAEVLTAAEWAGLDPAAERPGSWNRAFIQAEETLRSFQRSEAPAKAVHDAFRTGLRMAVTRDDKAVELAERYLTLEDVLDIKKRMVSSGLIGGKSVGMLLARAILRRAHPRWAEVVEPHDSFFIGSEVFYSFLVRNHCWRLRQRQKDPETFLDGAAEARQRMLFGDFHDSMRDRFMTLLDYFGQAPIIVRSSSLLEDNYGNAFAGKYDSVFCANQGPRHVRLDDFLAAVRAIYASSMSEEALTYRAERGVLDKDEQMALLVQRVSGVQYGSLFYPHAAGVAFSVNPYAWSPDIDPDAGMVRLVFGLGTRAVERSDDDYTRVVALNAPDKRPESGLDALRRYTQRRVDVLDLRANRLLSADFADVVRNSPGLPVELFASADEERLRESEGRPASAGGPAACPWLLTFDSFLRETDFAADMRAMLDTLQEAYECPVDIEFTVNFLRDGRYKINLLQCRALQAKGAPGRVLPPLPGDADIVLEGRGAVIGPSRVAPVDRLVYVVPEAYDALPLADRHEVARAVGRACHARCDVRSPSILLVGPGRWGTTTPALGVPVAFRDIRPAAALCEVVAMRDDLIPDVSLGTHFFNDLIETDILYAAVFPSREGNRLAPDAFEGAPNRLAEIAPDQAKWAHVVRVVEPGRRVGQGALHLWADTSAQRFVCYSGCS